MAPRIKPSEEAITKWAKRIKAQPTVMRMEIDFRQNRWWVTVIDERWSLPQGIFHDHLEDALQQMYLDLMRKGGKHLVSTG